MRGEAAGQHPDIGAVTGPDLQHVVAQVDAYGRFELTVNARVAGPRLGKDAQAVKAGEGVVNADGTLTAGTAVLQPEEYTSRLVAADPEYTAPPLDVSDRISVVMSVPPGRADWAATHRDLIAGEILATSFEFGEPADGVDIGDGVRVSIAEA